VIEPVALREGVRRELEAAICAYESALPRGDH
jgi:hypothetical protein